MVTPRNNIPAEVEGVPVKTIDTISEEEREDLIVISSKLIIVQHDVWRLLKHHRFKNVAYQHRHFLSLSIKERAYYTRRYGWNVNVSIPVYWQAQRNDPLDLKIYVVTSHFNLHKARGNLLALGYSTYIQAGATLTDIKMCELRDDVGTDNISVKNPFYCELTALYWLFKNEMRHEYMVFNLYSRVFAMNDEQLKYAIQNGIDVIVPEPEILFPSGKSVHKIGDYLERALAKISPSYLKTYEAVSEERVAVPSNLLIARRDIFGDYCKWLFEVMYEYENLLKTNMEEIPPRHFGYIAEGLLTMYFLHNSLDLNILFVRRMFLF